jgi:hypothetical protein
VIYKREISDELDSCARELEELGQWCLNSRRGWTCSELLIVINGCVLNFECNKVPL